MTFFREIIEKSCLIIYQYEPPEFGVSEKRTERKIDRLLLDIRTPRFENLKTALISIDRK